MEPGRIPTVKVCNPAEPGGFMIINECDRTDAHTLYVEAGSSPASTVPVEDQAEPVRRPRGRPRKVAA